CGFPRRLEYATTQHRSRQACRLDHRTGLGHLLDTVQNPPHRRDTDVDPLDPAPFTCRPADVTVLESAYAAGFSVHGHFGNMAGYGDGMNLDRRHETIDARQQTHDKGLKIK